jgi:hypothetical protein
MGSIIHCFLKNCFETDDDRNSASRGTYEEVNFMPPSIQPRLMTVNRSQTSPSVGRVVNDDCQNNDTDCTNSNINCNNSVPLSPSSNPDRNNLYTQSNRIIMLLNRFGIQAHVNSEKSNENQESIEAPAQRGQGLSLIPSSSNESHAQNLGQQDDANSFAPKLGRDNEICKNCDVAKSCASPLRVANAFHATDSTHEVPNIDLDEIVLPGSALQREMSIKMKEDLNKQEDECVICMETFDPSNPRMPTLCGCGENQTYFHLPCLYQWIEQNQNCPVCWQRLRWEEF